MWSPTHLETSLPHGSSTLPIHSDILLAPEPGFFFSLWAHGTEQWPHNYWVLSSRNLTVPFKFLREIKLRSDKVSSPINKALMEPGSRTTDMTSGMTGQREGYLLEKLHSHPSVSEVSNEVSKPIFPLSFLPCFLPSLSSPSLPSFPLSFFGQIFIECFSCPQQWGPSYS